MRFSKAAIAGVMLMAACSAEGPVRFDGSYRLADIDGTPIPGSADLTIEGARIHGNGPCNSYFSENRATWPQVDLAAIGATRRACLIEGGEGRFFEALGQADTAERTETGLILQGPGGRLRFTAE